MTTNPWLPHVSSEPTTPAPVPAPPGRRHHELGARRPQLGVPVPDRVDQLPTRDQPNIAALWWLGVHGGAGETTLARLLPGTRPAEHAWPRPPATTYVPTRVVLAARSHASGLRAAQKAATHWAAGAMPDVQLLGLVIVADAPGRLPKPLRELAALVSGGVPQTWHVPWIESWRLGDDVALETAPREVRRLITDLTALTPQLGPAAGDDR